jgi:hypothetical protein
MKTEKIEVEPVIPLNDSERVYDCNRRYLFRENGVWYSGRVIWSGSKQIHEAKYMESALPGVAITDKRIENRHIRNLEPYEPVFKVTFKALRNQHSLKSLEKILAPLEKTPYTELLKQEVLSQFPEIVANFTERDYRPPLGPL